MKLQELGKVAFNKVYGCNTSGEGSCDPRLFLKEEGRMKEIFWQFNPEGTHRDDGGYWYHDLFILLPFGAEVYMMGQIEFVGDDFFNQKIEVLKWIPFDAEKAEMGSEVIFAS